MCHRVVVDADVNALFGVLEVGENASTSSPLQRVLTVWAEILLRSPRKRLIFIIKKYIHRIKVSKTK